MVASTPKPASARPRNAGASRSAILEQAVAEFAAQGVAGARTAAIAEAAGVNKALLYYYFKDKESLYAASLQAVFSGFAEELMPVLESPLSPGEKLLRFARAHFEYLVRHPNYPRLIQQELSCAGSRGEPSGGFRDISTAHFLPMQRAGMRVVKQGIASGELRPVEGAGTLSAVIGMNVFYFISAPIMRALRGADPFSPRARRAHIASSLDFIAASLFTDRRHGISLAQKIAEAPSALPRKPQNGPSEVRS
ncbi:MAG: TetR/AcrR family transcriptional regulator [Candidatus Korobacteraceae bacterium]